MLNLNRRKFLQYTGAAGATLATGGLAGAARAEGPLKIGVVYVSPIAEIGWTKQHSLAVEAVKKEFGDKVEITVLDNIFMPQDAERVFRELAASGNQLIFGTSFSHGTPLQLINTHLGLRRGERLAQVEALLGPDWLSHPDYSSAHRLLIGDFNSIPSSPAYRRLAAEIADVQPPVLRHRATFPSRFPVFRLDHIFASRGLACTQAQVIETSLARRASDHLPLVASFALPDARAAEQKEETRG